MIPNNVVRYLLGLMVVSFTIAAKNLQTLGQSVEVAFKKYTEEDKSLCQKLQKNRTEQQELQQRLNALKEHEQQLEEDRQKRKEIQEKADQVRFRDMKQMQVVRIIIFLLELFRLHYVEIVILLVVGYVIHFPRT